MSPHPSLSPNPPLLGSLGKAPVENRIMTPKVVRVLTPDPVNATLHGRVPRRGGQVSVPEMGDDPGLS